MATIVIIGGGGGGGNQNKALADGTIVDEQGATVAKFDTYDQAIAYLQHLSGQASNGVELS